MRVVARRGGCCTLSASYPGRGESLEHRECPCAWRDQVPWRQVGLEQERHGRWRRTVTARRSLPALAS